MDGLHTLVTMILWDLGRFIIGHILYHSLSRLIFPICRLRGSYGSSASILSPPESEDSYRF